MNLLRINKNIHEKRSSLLNPPPPPQPEGTFVHKEINNCLFDTNSFVFYLPQILAKYFILFSPRSPPQRTLKSRRTLNNSMETIELFNRTVFFTGKLTLKYQVKQFLFAEVEYHRVIFSLQVMP